MSYHKYKRIRNPLRFELNKYWFETNMIPRTSPYNFVVLKHIYMITYLTLFTASDKSNAASLELIFQYNKITL